MSLETVYITGLGCLTPLGLDPDTFVQGLGGEVNGLAPLELPAGCAAGTILAGQVGDFSKSLAAYVRPALRRKMSRLSRMAVVAAGDALTAAGIVGPDKVYEDTGIALGTAFGSTGQSELFFLDLVEQDPAKVNPGFFPETVPNAPAGQVSIAFKLKGPNTTVCQQNLSPDLALLFAMDMLASGMADRMLVVGVEEMSGALLTGLDAMGLLHRKAAMSDKGILLTSKIVPGEAAVALVVESAKSVRARGVTPLASLLDAGSRGAAIWPAVYHGVDESVRSVVSSVMARNTDNKPDVVVANGSFVAGADLPHYQSLAGLLGDDTLLSVPEYATGNLMGGGLLRILSAVLLLQGENVPCCRLAEPGSGKILFDQLFSRQVSSVGNVLTSTISPGGGACAVLLGKA